MVKRAAKKKAAKKAKPVDKTQPRNIVKAGVYDLSHRAYHDDPCKVPSLSASIANLIITRSPRHAMLAHPRLNPALERVHKKIFDMGEAAHEMLLGGDKRLGIIDAENYQGKDAQRLRQIAYDVNRIPVLSRQFVTLRAMVGACRAQLKRHEDAAGAFDKGKPEQTLIWEESGVWFRVRLDWLPAAGNVFYNYKSTGGLASGDEWGKRQMFDLGDDLSAALYCRGITKVLGIKSPIYRFIVQETEPPFALCVHQLSPHAFAEAQEDLEYAIGWWRWCMDKKAWPGYPRRVCYIDRPPWRSQAQADRKNRETYMGEAGEDVRKLALDWQAPL